jgi:6-phosphogluconate dehydrogenase
MNVGIIGLGRIGSAVAQRLINADYTVIGYDKDVQARNQAEALGVTVVKQSELVAQKVRVIWLFLPAGEVIDHVLGNLMSHMKAGDIIIDGGNSNYTNSQMRARMLESSGFFLLDCGTSGGLQGRGNGFCLMVGGDKSAYTKVHSMLECIATPGGLAHVGPAGAGHYTKMVHNAIEYALLEAYGEGLQLLKEGDFKKESLDLEEITRIWQNGSIIRSWILELTHSILERDQDLETVIGSIEEMGTGRWAIENAHKNNVTMPAIEAALDVRAQSRKTGGNFATKIVALLRHEFGGHPYKKK